MNFEKNLDKNILTYTITLEPEDYKKYQYQAFLGDRKRFMTKNLLRPEFNEVLEITPDNMFNDITVNRMEDVLFDAIKDDNDNLVVEPTIIDVQNDEDNLVVTVMALNEPEIELYDYKNKLVRPQEDFEVSEEELEKELDQIVKSNARLIPVEDELQKGHQADVTVKVIDTVKPDVPIAGGNSSVISFEEENLANLLNEFNPFIIDNVLGSKVGDVVEFPVDVSMNLKEINSTEVDEAPYILSFEINQIYEPEYAELDDDFASEVSEFDTLEELKEETKKNLAKLKEEIYWDTVNKSNYNHILRDSSVELPEGFYEILEDDLNNHYTNYIMHQNPQDLYLYAANQNYFKTLVQEELVFQILNKIADELEVEVTEEEVEELKNILNSNQVTDKYLGYNIGLLQSIFNDIPNLTDRELEDFYNYIILKNKVNNKLQEYTTIVETVEE